MSIGKIVGFRLKIEILGLSRTRCLTESRVGMQMQNLFHRILSKFLQKLLMLGVGLKYGDVGVLVARCRCRIFGEILRIYYTLCTSISAPYYSWSPLNNMLIIENYTQQPC